MHKNKGIRWIVCVGMLSLPQAFAAGFELPTYYTIPGGYQAFIMRPSTPLGSGPTPWVFFAPSYAASYPNSTQGWLIQHLLDSGIAVAGVDVGESYGSPAGNAGYTAFYNYATTKANLAPNTCLLGQSRGGLMMYRWAIENPDKVDAIAAIYPIADIRSWPGIATAAPVYGLTVDQLTTNLSEYNPIDRLQSLADAKIPLFSICGSADAYTAPNSQVVYDRYKALGGTMDLVIVPGRGHEEIPEYFQSTQLLDFMVAHSSITPEPGTAMLVATALFVLLAYAWYKRK